MLERFSFHSFADLVCFEQSLYGLGARRIGVTSLPPLGCLPAARTLFGYHDKGCVSRINTDAQQFNKKITSAASQMQKQNSGLKIVVFDVFQPLYDLVANPSRNGTIDLFSASNLVQAKKFTDS